MRNSFRMAAVLLLLPALITACCPQRCHKHPKSHYIEVSSRQEMHRYFRYDAGRATIISGHRGGMMTGYPENCIESFEKTLTMMPSFFEIDPRLTKDSIIVLMHDKTIDRTTTGKGKVSDFTYAQLQQFNLVDRDGNVTPYKIPTLKECIEWSRGKTILNLDIKDVPLDFMSAFINSINPVNVIYTVRNAAQARQYLDQTPDIGFSIWCKNMKEFAEYEAAGIPWGQVQAYIGPKIKPEQAELLEALHRNGVMYMISVAPTHDKLSTDAERVAGYKSEIATRPDVIETDYPYLFANLDLAKR